MDSNRTQLVVIAHYDLYSKSSVILALLIDKLNSLVTTGAFVSDVALSMWAEMPSGPLAFVTSSDVRREKTSFSVHKSRSGQALGSTSID